MQHNSNHITLLALALGFAFNSGCLLDEQDDYLGPPRGDLEQQTQHLDEREGDLTEEDHNLEQLDIDQLLDEADKMASSRDYGGTRWIVAFHDARSLQQALDEAEAQHGLAPGSLKRINGTMVAMRRDVEAAERRAAQSRVAALSKRRDIPMSHVRVLATGADLVDLGPDSWERAERLRKDPEIRYVEPDARMMTTSVNDTYWSLQWHYHQTGGGLSLPDAWNISTGQDVVVAVLDTGSTSHPDLNANTLPGYDFISDEDNARDFTGRDDDPSDEGDWRLTDGECGPESKSRNSTWHGTHVAGTIAAVTDNASGVAGVAYDAKILHARVLGKCGGSTSDIADAIVWASGDAVDGVDNPNPADIINMSLGGEGACSSTYQDAIDTAVDNGTTIVVSAGNKNIDASNQRPANCNNVITVAASDSQGNRASFSNYGTKVDVTAPGKSVLSTLNTGNTTPSSSTYNYKNGTSMAAPHVAGVVALLKSQNPSLSPASIESKLKDTARAPGSECSAGCGAGLVDAAAALGSTCVRFYEHENYNGDDTSVCVSSQSFVSWSWNDRISSFHVPRGYKLTVYEHSNYSGSSRDYYGNVPNVGSFWNDKISSWKLISFNSSKCLAAYRDAHYRGEVWQFCPQSSGFNQNFGSNWNDQFSSLWLSSKVTKVKVYSDSNWSGSSATFYKNTDYLGSMNDVVSSFTWWTTN